MSTYDELLAHREALLIDLAASLGREDALKADLATRTTQLSQVTLRMRELEQEKAELAAALKCAESLFDRKWNGVVGSGAEFHWQPVGNWRHYTCKMTGETFLESISKVKQ